MTASFDPHLPIGAKGTIDSVEYEVLGWTLKEENNHYASQWREYCLFNAKEGFAFLSEYDGNSTFLKEKKNAPVLNKDGVKSIEYNGENFERFNQYTHKVIAANGSFPYNILIIRIHLQQNIFLLPKYGSGKSIVQKEFVGTMVHIFLKKHLNVLSIMK
ncbi:MAG: DUF4178 domain-containing protein [Chitinophagaceae bacterium]|nr:DUF4178 domain-containing protein [Chitinophagaceae bacterium]